jgi:hypothetical protein
MDAEKLFKYYVTSQLYEFCNLFADSSISTDNNIFCLKIALQAKTCGKVEQIHCPTFISSYIRRCFSKKSKL